MASPSTTPTNTSPSTDKGINITLWGVIAGIIVLLLWLVNWFWIGNAFCMEQGGQFGDRFGATTSLFGGITIIGLIVTILLQREDIKIARKSFDEQVKQLKLANDAFNEQKKELELNRETLKLNQTELELSRTEFEQQNLTLKYQRFESTFVNLLNAHQTFLDSILLHDQFGEINKGEAIFMRLNEITDRILGNASKDDAMGIYKQEVIFKHQQIREYLRSLNMVLKFIDRFEMRTTDRNLYYEIVNSRMSQQERLFLIVHTKYVDKGDSFQKEKVERLEKATQEF
jgi:hypothetical protein